jgi:polyisoprenoid-binding protein YceI
MRCCVVQPAAPCQANPPAPASAAAAAPAAQPDTYAWKALFDGKTLKGWKAPEFGGEGRVYVEDGMIVMEMGNNMTGVTYTAPVPRDNYELSLEGMRLEGSDFFCTTTFPVGTFPCTLVVGGWGGTVVGLSNVDFFDASENPTTTFQAFKDKQWYHVRIRVTEPKIEAWVDDEQVVDQDRPGHRFDIRFEVDLCQPLGIATWCSKGAVRNIRLRQLPPTPAADQPAQK